MKTRDDLSCTLLSLALEKAVRNSEIQTEGTAYNKGTQILAYADDKVTAGRSTDALKKLMKAAQAMGLAVSTQKATYVEVIRGPANIKMIVTGNQQHERGQEFKCLGTNLTEDNDVSTEIKQRITMANKTSCGLKKQVNSRI
jgi:sorting nexin-29